MTAPRSHETGAVLADLAREIGRPLTFMEVCGTHTMSAARAGLRSLLTETVRLLSGPLWRRWQGRVLPHVQGRVLEVGCGTGLLLERLSARGQAVGVDLSRGMLGKARERLEGMDGGKLVLADAQRLPFEDGSFDSAVSTFALTAVPDLDAALGEMVRVLRNGGTLAIVSVGAPESGSRLTRVATALVRKMSWLDIRIALSSDCRPRTISMQPLAPSNTSRSQPCVSILRKTRGSGMSPAIRSQRPSRRRTGTSRLTTSSALRFIAARP